LHKLQEIRAITAFRIRLADRLIEGRVEDRDKAFDKYDDALIKGDGACLIDEDRIIPTGMLLINGQEFTAWADNYVQNNIKAD
jgi:hypothetical protein